MPASPGFNSSFGGYTPERASEISRDVDRLVHGNYPFSSGRPDNTSTPAGGRWVRLLEPLVKATNATNGQTEADFRFLVDDLDPDNRNIDDSESTDPDGVVVNRSPTYEAGTGDVLLVLPIDGSEDEWAPVVSGGSGPVTVTGSCGCDCIDDGDITVDGYTTTSQWTVSLSEVVVQETHGTVHLPANEHVLAWNSGGGYWQKNIGSELLAYRTSGASYPLSPAPSPAYIRFDNSDSGYMTLKIVWPDNLIPAP